MNNESSELVPVFVPALCALLIAAEDQKGSPLTEEEVLEIRDNSSCIMMKLADAEKMAESRGPDINPKACWYDWQMLRRELGRKPDLDQGRWSISFKTKIPRIWRPSKRRKVACPPSGIWLRIEIPTR